MFTKGQLVFGACFIVAFAALMFWSYRKDLHIHRKHYKNTLIVIITVFLVIAIFTLITFSLH